jgi:sialic acid synthase SpsE
MREIKLKFNKKIGEKHPCFIIAEIGVNHNGKISLARKLIDKAKSSGADAVKFQTFHTEDLILKNSPKAKYHIETTGSDKKQSWYNLLKTQELTLKMHKELIKYCNKKRIIFISTPYDFKSIDMLKELNVSIYKIASCDLNNHPLISRVARSKKPIIISTGMSNLDEIQSTYNKFKNHNTILLQCTGNYPADNNEANINVMDVFKKKFKCLIGYSDHLLNNYGALAAIAKGAKVYEKHITLNKNMNGPDHRTSYEPKEFKKLVNDIRNIEIIKERSISTETLSEAVTEKGLLRAIFLSFKYCFASTNIIRVHYYSFCCHIKYTRYMYCFIANMLHYLLLPIINDVYICVCNCR